MTMVSSTKTSHSHREYATKSLRWMKVMPLGLLVSLDGAHRMDIHVAQGLVAEGVLTPDKDGGLFDIPQTYTLQEPN